jgi:hypothetical protein
MVSCRSWQWNQVVGSAGQNSGSLTATAFTLTVGGAGAVGGGRPDRAAATACCMCSWMAASNSCCCDDVVMLWPGWEYWVNSTTTGGMRTVSPTQQQQREKMLAGDTGCNWCRLQVCLVSEREKKILIFCDTTAAKKKQQTVSQVRPTVRRIRTVPDGTVGEWYANGFNDSTITQTRADWR